MAGGSVEGEDK
jgi:hypothetical protein